MEEHDEVEEGEIDDDEDDDEELEEQRRSPSSFGQPRGDSSGKNAVYSEEFASFSSSREHHMSSPRFNTGRGHHDFSRFDMGSSGSSPLHGWSDAIDEKGESIALQIHLEKSIVHQKFFNSKCLCVWNILRVVGHLY
jgi:hypothetical protein